MNKMAIVSVNLTFPCNPGKRIYFWVQQYTCCIHLHNLWMLHHISVTFWQISITTTFSFNLFLFSVTWLSYMQCIDIYTPQFIEYKYVCVCCVHFMQERYSPDNKATMKMKWKMPFRKLKTHSTPVLKLKYVQQSAFDSKIPF